MNFDILIKLIKLANHNNSDGEANSAARRACKMLSEDNYKWIESVSKNGKAKVNQSQEWHPYEDPFWDLWNHIKRDAQRQKEREERERRYEEARQRAEERQESYHSRQKYKNPFTGQWEKYNVYDEGRAQEDAKRREEQWKARTGYERGPINYEFTGSKGYKKVYRERLRRCVTCGFDRMTTDESPAYVCAKCK